VPNWCFNRLEIYGSDHDLRTIAEMVATPEGFDLTVVKPMPVALLGSVSPVPASPDPNPRWAELLAAGEMTQEWHDELVEMTRVRYENAQILLATTGFTDWYSWAIRNWGVKWSPKEVDFTDYMDYHMPHIHYRFETPWGPPLALIEAWATKFPDCYFALGFAEESMAFVGVHVLHGDESWECEYNDEKDWPEEFQHKRAAIEQAHHDSENAVGDLYDPHEYYIALSELEGDVLEDAFDTAIELIGLKMSSKVGG